jgi:hypothetical protein
MSVSTKRQGLRIGYLFVVGLISFWISYCIQEKYYVVAAVLSFLAVALSVLDYLDLPHPKPLLADSYTLNRWVVNKIVSTDTIARIETRLERLYGVLNFDPSLRVHITVHLAIRAFNSQGIHSDWLLIQLTNYVGPGRRGKNRVVSAHKGVIGRAYRTRMPQTVNFDSQEDYFKRMTEEFSFYPDEANYHATEARSYFCMPYGLDDGEPPLIVLYAYSTKCGLFNDDSSAVSSRENHEACADIANILASDELVKKARTT